MRNSRWGGLKRSRVAASLVVVSVVTILFLDIWHFLPPAAGSAILSFQIIPSFLKLLATWTVLPAAAFILILLLTFIFGRVYCSFLCPLGVLQDIIIRLARKANRRKRFRFHTSLTAFHYTFAGISIAAAVAGSMLILDCFEPYSIYGRIITSVVQPGVIFFNNIGARLLIALHVYSLHTIQYQWMTIGTFGVTFGLLLLVGAMAYTRGRLFCNTICPAGAVLGIMSRATLMKLEIDRRTCDNCGACERVCKAECIDSRTKRLDMGSCVGCFNCIHSCPSNSIGYHRNIMKSRTPERSPYDKGRRLFFGSLGSPVVAVLLPVIQTKNPEKPVKSPVPVTPPGSKSLGHFTGTCTACQLCVTTCPTRVLTPTLFEYGITGILQPMMNYSSGYCNYECTACGDICPTGAIMKLGIDVKKLVQIGKSTFVKDDCIVVSKKKDCAACSEHCPTKAVHTVPYESGLFLPELNNDLCIGCGACEFACPTQPVKAIFVTPNAIHLTAKKPEVKSQPQPFDQRNDFPF